MYEIESDPATLLRCFTGKINDKACAAEETARAAQRCDPTDEMKVSPELPDALLKSETQGRDGEDRQG